MKKVLAVVAVIAVVCVAGAALAQPRARDDARRMPPQIQKEFSGERGHIDQRQAPQFPGDPNFAGRCPAGMNAAPFEGRGRGFCGRGHGHGRLGFVPGMPEEIRAKAVEAAKLRIDLEEVLSRRPVDKAKAMEVFGKIQQAENAVETWKFGNRLDMMEKAKIMRELDKISKPAPKTEE